MGGAHDDKLERLKTELEFAEDALRGVLAFIKDARNLTDRGIAERDALLQDIEESRRDLEAVRREQAPDE